jgi:ssDNA-binding Zn-finger/Zn-ribbon topoisomerase 1
LIIEEMNQSKLKNDNDEIIKCPKCQSDQLIYGFKSMKGTKGILSGIISFILIIFPIYYNTVNKCKDCGHEF